MSRYKGRTSAKETARLYPFVVEVVLPEGGLGRRLDDMLNFAAKAGKPLGGVESYFTIRSYCWIPLQLANGICIDTGKIGESGTPIKIFISRASPCRSEPVYRAPGLDAKAVMGHAIAMTFDRYGHLFADHDNDREAMKRLQAAVVAA